MNDAWFYMVGNQHFGPVPLAEIRRLVHTGQLGPMASVWTQGAVAALTAGQAVGGAPIGPDGDAMRFIAPTAQTSGMALLSGYLGIFGFFFCALGPIAILTGFLGLRDLKKNPHKHGVGRAWTGIILGGIQTLIGLYLVYLISQGK